MTGIRTIVIWDDTGDDLGVCRYMMVSLAYRFVVTKLYTEEKSKNVQV